MSIFSGDSFFIQLFKGSIILNWFRKKPKVPFVEIIDNSSSKYYYSKLNRYLESSLIYSLVLKGYEYFVQLSFRDLSLIIAFILIIGNIIILKYWGVSLATFFVIFGISLFFFLIYIFYELSPIKNSVIINTLQNWWTELMRNIAVPFWAFFPFFDLFFRRFTSLRGYWDEIFLLIFLSLTFILGIKYKVKFPAYGFYLLLFYYLIILSAFLSPYPLFINIEGLRSITLPTLIFFVIYIFLKIDKKPEKVFSFIAVSCLFLGVIGIFQYVLGFDMPVGWVDVDYEALIIRTRAFSIIGSPNFLAGYLLFGIGTSISLLLASKQWSKRVLWGLVLLINSVSIALTFARGAFLALGAAVAFLAVLSGPLILIIFLFGSGISYLVAPTLAHRILFLFSPEYISKSLTAGGRLSRWLMALDHIKENLWLGSGPGTFGGGPAIKHGFFQGISVDSYLLKMFAEVGLIGGISFLLLFLILFRYGLWVLLDKNKLLSLRFLTLGGLISMIAFFLHNGVENLWDAPGMVVYFSMLAAALVYLGEEM